jgi:hypothetical protein
MPIPEPQIVGDLPEAKKFPPPRGTQRGATITPMKARGVVTQPEDRHRPRQAAKPFLLEHDILKVTNVDDVDWEFKWDRRKYLVKRNETGYVPFPALVIKLGDPRSVDGAVTRFNTDDGQRGIIPERHDSLTTLFAHYGIENENIDELVDFAPKLEVRTMDGDEIVTFPSQDPRMAAWPVPQVPQPGRENSDTRRQMDNLASENESMRAELAELRGMISGRLSGSEEAAPTPRAAVTEPDDGADLAAALAGATVDQGPSSQFG